MMNANVKDPQYANLMKEHMNQNQQNLKIWNKQKEDRKRHKAQQAQLLKQAKRLSAKTKRP
jgi:hypothetical protein